MGLSLRYSIGYVRSKIFSFAPGLPKTFGGCTRVFQSIHCPVLAIPRRIFFKKKIQDQPKRQKTKMKRDITDEIDDIVGDDEDDGCEEAWHSNLKN